MPDVRSDHFDVSEEDLKNGWRRVYETDENGVEYSRLKQVIKPFKLERSYAKVIKSGPITEVYIFEKPTFLKAKGSPKCFWRTGRKKQGELGEDYARKAENRGRSTIKARNMVRRLAVKNFSEHASKFLTLTFSDNPTAFNKTTGQTWEFKHWKQRIKVPKVTVTEVEGVAKRSTKSVEVDFNYRLVEHTNVAFKQFMQRMRYEYGDFKYLAVPEFQDKNGRGAVHYHMIADLPYIKLKDLSQELWGWGFVLITDIRHVDNVGAYISDYMTEDINDFRLCGKKSYLVSSNLEKPDQVNSYAAYEEISNLKWDEKKPVYEREYGNQESYIGRIQYLEYNDKRKTLFRPKSKKGTRGNGNSANTPIIPQKSQK